MGGVGRIRGRALRVGWVGLVGAALLLLVHCGGSAVENAPKTPVGGSGGAADYGGSGGTASGGAGAGGTAEIVVGNAGAAAGAVGGEGGAWVCAAQCPAGQRLDRSLGPCPICVAAGCQGVCEESDCANGTGLTEPKPPDLCCPICDFTGAAAGAGGANGEAGSGSATACADATASYQTYQKSLLTDDVLACDSDEDCMLVNSKFACGSNCTFAVNSRQFFEVTDALDERALATCSQCASPSPRICPPFAIPVCQNHRCMLPTP